MCLLSRLYKFKMHVPNKKIKLNLTPRGPTRHKEGKWVPKTSKEILTSLLAMGPTPRPRLCQVPTPRRSVVLAPGLVRARSKNGLLQRTWHLLPKNVQLPAATRQALPAPALKIVMQRPAARSQALPALPTLSCTRCKDLPKDEQGAAARSGQSHRRVPTQQEEFQRQMGA